MLRKLLLVTSFIVLALAGLCFWGYRDLRTPISHSKAGQYVEIPRGTTPKTIVKKLADEGIIRHQWPLLVYIKLRGLGSRFRSGEYKFPSPISPLAVAARIQQGQERLLRFTIIEGWTRWDVAEALSRIPELNTDADSALDLMGNVKLIKDLDPKAHNLEGYLFPDTYQFSPDTSAAEVVDLAVKRFRAVWRPEWSTDATRLHLSPREAVTVASLIETEAKIKDERPLIASVIYNRLRLDMALGIDSSVIYASKLEGKWRDDGKVYKSDLERQSPYNTRLRPGLPPGPIASPGESSLVAALNPATTDYLYYVREPTRMDGTHNFYDNEKDFQKGVTALREWERENK